MPFERITLVVVGLAVFSLGFGMFLSSPAVARQTKKQQRSYVEQRPAYVQQRVAPTITVMPRNTPKSYVVCWTPCHQPGAIVMGADPDLFIRSQILRDASGFFGGGGR